MWLVADETYEYFTYDGAVHKSPHASNGMPKEPYTSSKEPHILSKEPHILSKEPYILSKEPYILSKEPYILSKEPYILSKEPYIHCHTGPDVFGIHRPLCEHM